MHARFRALRPLTLALALAIALGGGLFVRQGSAPVAEAAPPAAPVVEVAMRNTSFQPSTLTIAPGTTVRWTNYDPIGHDVSGTFNGTQVRSPLLGTGQTFEYTFNEPGVFDYLCNPHRVVMKGRITVEGPPSGGRLFPETGKTVSGRFLAYWQANGLEFGDPGVTERESLALFGFPISDVITEKIDGKDYEVQYFERARFELHTDGATGQPIVLLGQFGRILHPADPPVAQKPGARYFPETGHNVDGRFLEYWNQNGGLPIFGYPLSEPIQEQLGDGNTYTVQYFERARFELHPGNQPPYDVLLGQFGRLIYGQR
jgi:plastocyanin